MNSLKIETDRVDEVVSLIEQIPELDSSLTRKGILRRIEASPHLILTAH